jgi:hypothetical protein
VIVQMCLALFLNCYKWYQNNLTTPCSVEAQHGVGPDEDVRDLSRRD